MDLRTIIASCLVPVLFGFLAEAIPHYYHSQSPAALSTSDDNDTLQRMFGSFEEPNSSEYDGNHKSENPYVSLDKNPEASDWLEENGNKEQNGINRKGISEWQDLIDNNELMLGGNQKAVATLRHRTEMSDDDDYTEISDRDYDNNYGNDDDSEEPLLDYDTETKISDLEHDNDGINFFNFPVNDYENESGEPESETRFSDLEHDKNDLDYYNFREPQYIDPPPKNDDDDDYTEISDREYYNNYENQDDLGEPMSDYETRFSDWEHDKNGVNDYNFPVNNHDESMEPMSDYETRFPDWEHDNNGVNDYNIPLNNNHENYDGSVEAHPRKSPTKITKIFKIVKIVHRSDMQSKNQCPEGKRFDKIRNRCVEKPSVLFGTLGDRWRHGYYQHYRNNYNDDSIRYLCPPGYEYDSVLDECVRCPPGSTYDSNSGTCVPFYDSRLGAIGRLDHGHHRANAQSGGYHSGHPGGQGGQGGQGGHKGGHHGVPQPAFYPRSSWWNWWFYGKSANK